MYYSNAVLFNNNVYSDGNTFYYMYAFTPQNLRFLKRIWNSHLIIFVGLLEYLRYLSKIIHTSLGFGISWVRTSFFMHEFQLRICEHSACLLPSCQQRILF